MKIAIGFAAIVVNLLGWWFLDRIVLGNPPLTMKQEFPIAMSAAGHFGIIMLMMQ